MQFDPAIDALTLIRRARASKDYDERLDGLAEGFERAVREARALTPQTAPGARPLLHAAVEGSVPGRCHPMCCQASWSRAVVLRGRHDVIVAWARVDAGAARDFSTTALDGLFIPQSRAIAIATAQMFCRSPDAALSRVDYLAEIAQTHPRWQVQLAAAHAVRVACRAGTAATVVEQVVEHLLNAGNHPLRQEGERLRRAVTRAAV